MGRCSTSSIRKTICQRSSRAGSTARPRMRSPFRNEYEPWAIVYRCASNACSRPRNGMPCLPWIKLDFASHRAARRWASGSITQAVELQASQSILRHPVQRKGGGAHTSPCLWTSFPVHGNALRNMPVCSAPNQWNVQISWISNSLSWRLQNEAELVQSDEPHRDSGVPVSLRARTSYVLRRTPAPC